MSKMTNLTPLFKASLFFSVVFTAFMSFVFFVLTRQEVNISSVALMFIVIPLFTFGGYYFGLKFILKQHDLDE
jgi:ABC-type multidrug transport system permease subunit